jgi:hypothetical protein
MAGTFVAQTRVGIPPKGRRDVDGGHINPGPNNVGTNIIIPDDPNAIYLANNVRYAEGSNFDAFDYSFTLPATNGYSRTIYAPVSTAGRADNYVEVANMLEEDVDITLRFTDDEGFLISESTVTFSPLSQRHFPIVGLLDAEVNGYVSITPNKPNAVVAQSVFYHRDFRNRSIQTAYASPAREPFGTRLYTTYNFFLGMLNMMRIMNIGDATADIHYSYGDDRAQHHISLAKDSAMEFTLGRERSAQGAASYGIITIEASKAGAIASELVRTKQLASGKYEFAIDTPAR